SQEKGSVSITLRWALSRNENRSKRARGKDPPHIKAEPPTDVESNGGVVDKVPTYPTNFPKQNPSSSDTSASRAPDRSARGATWDRPSTEIACRLSAIRR